MASLGVQARNLAIGFSLMYVTVLLQMDLGGIQPYIDQAYSILDVIMPYVVIILEYILPILQPIGEFYQTNMVKLFSVLPNDSFLVYGIVGVAILVVFIIWQIKSPEEPAPKDDD